MLWTAPKVNWILKPDKSEAQHTTAGNQQTLRIPVAIVVLAMLLVLYVAVLIVFS
jgi:hypothetical protein